MAKLIIIIGGGIGGLTLAACLRLRGVTAYVYERAAELREVGAALGLFPNATRVLKHLGLLESLMQRAHLPPAGALRDRRGKTLKKMVALQADVPALFLHRADLHQVLLSAIPPEQVHLNKTFASLEQDGKQVRAIFADGTASDWADGLVGADGIRSIVREKTLADGPPTYRGYIAWRGVAEFDPDEEIVGETWGCGMRFGFIPLGGGRVGWWATANKPGHLGRDTCAQPRASWKTELLQRFGNWHAPIPAVLAATPESALLCNEMLDRPMLKSPPPQPWGTGPITLLGDAAHPTTPNLGQGACMAIEDAAIAAQAIECLPDTAIAFRVYERTRYARTAMIVRESLKFGKIGQWQNPVACALRDFSLRFAPDSTLRKQFQELWLYDAWNAPLVMPQ